ncbi:HNH endonuclease [Salmonella enterica]|nr:HNH endonuclease [Salmonella enterica]
MIENLSHNYLHELKNRFLAKVDINSVYVPENMETECHIWMAGKSCRGYGRISVNGKVVKAHRLSYEFRKGIIPEGKVVIHLCDNPSCVNPDHLAVGTVSDNNADMRHKGRAKYQTGEQNGNSKLTNDKIFDIRRDIRSNRIIAKEYNISHTHVGLIKNKKIWKHL